MIDDANFPADSKFFQFEPAEFRLFTLVVSMQETCIENIIAGSINF